MKVILLPLILVLLAGCSDDTPGAADGATDLGADAATPDAKKTCAKPRPFLPPSKPAGWKHSSTKLLVVI